jgi:hypothetical protein
MFDGLELRILLLSKCWVSNPKWSKSETELNATSVTSDNPVLSLPK